MNPTSLSATAIHVFETCPARFKAEFIDRTPRIDQKSGNLGSAVHEVLEIFVKDGHYLKGDSDSQRKVLRVLWESTYYKYFVDNEKLDEGWSFISDWLDRCDWTDREVISTEVKEEFMLVIKVTDTLTVEIPFRYIWDRCDRVKGSQIEVVDYKTNVIPVSFEDLKRKMQVRMYGLMASIKFKDENPTKIWVTLDMLRHGGPVGVTFSREENIETWNYLRNVVIRILETDDEAPPENLNPECRFCVRASTCESLAKHTAGGGILSFKDKNEAADRRMVLYSALKAIETQLGTLDEFLREACEEDGVKEFTTENTRVALKGRSYRTFDSERGRDIIPPEVFAKYGSMPVTALDKMLKAGALTEEQTRAVKMLISRSYSKLSITTEPLTPWDDEGD